MAAMPPVLVLLNPLAANGRAGALAEPMRRWLAEQAPLAGLIVSDSIERSRAQVQCLPRSSRVIVVGGDGTLHHLLPVLLTHRLSLGLVPQGRGNHTARALGLSRLPWQQALELALTGTTRRMDIGELRSERIRRPFISGLVAGLDVDALQAASDGPAGLPARLRGWQALVREHARLRLQRLHLIVDGRPVHDGALRLATLLNTPSCAFGTAVHPKARIADGRLDLMCGHEPSSIGSLRLLSRLRAGRRPDDSPAQRRPFQSLRIDGSAPLPLVVDGEPLAPLAGFDVRVVASAITVAVLRPGSPAAPAAEAVASAGAGEVPDG